MSLFRTTQSIFAILLFAMLGKSSASSEEMTVLDACNQVISSLQLVDVHFSCNYSSAGLNIDTGNYTQVLQGFETNNEVYSRLENDFSYSYNASSTLRLFTEIALRIASRSANLDATRIKFVETFGYCSHSWHFLVFDFASARLKVRLEEGGHTQMACSLNFQAIARYEAAVHTAYTRYAKINNKTIIDASPQGASRFLDDVSDVVLRMLPAQENVSSIVSGENFLILKVAGIQGFAIDGETFWERLQHHFFIVKESVAGVEYVMVLDGQYGPGLQPPSTSGYYDMQPKYTQQLFDYGQALISAIQEKMDE